MKRAFLLLIIAIVAALISITAGNTKSAQASGSVFGSSITTVSGGAANFSHGFFKHSVSPLPSTFSADIRENAHATNSGDHVIGWIAMLDTSGSPFATYPEIQDGIWAENGGAPRFYVEVAGYQMPQPPGPSGTWEPRTDGSVPWDGINFWEHFWTNTNPPAPVDGTYYHFSVSYNSTNQTVTGSGPGWTSPAISMTLTAGPAVWMSNEVENAPGNVPVSSYDYHNTSPAYSFSYTSDGTATFYHGNNWIDSPNIDCAVHGTICGRPTG